MPIVLENYPVIYQPTPKVACTSVKHALYKLDHGHRHKWHRDEHGRERNIHNSWQGGTEPFKKVKRSKGSFTFCVVRDPIKRIISAYSNRVLFHNALDEGCKDEERLILLGLPFRPDLETFIENLESYRLASFQIRHHTDHQIRYIGFDLSYYDAIYDIADLGVAAERLSSITAREVLFGREQDGGPKIPVSAIKRKHLRMLRDYCDPDYRLLKDRYKMRLGLFRSSFS